MQRRSAVLAAALPLVLLACDRPADGSRGASSSDPRATPGYVIDSIHPPGEALRRFRAGLVEPTAFDGPTSRDELYRRFADALRRQDGNALAGLSVTRAEYAFLVYPELSISRPPYNQPPEVAWTLLLQSSRAGYTRVLDRAPRFTLEGYQCPAEPKSEGRIRVWSGCTVSARVDGAPRTLRLFGAIVERDGRFKLASFANDL